jgi:hypothetical protein
VDPETFNLELKHHRENLTIVLIIAPLGSRSGHADRPLVAD